MPEGRRLAEPVVRNVLPQALCVGLVVLLYSALDERRSTRAEELALAVTADSHVEEALPDHNYGGEDRLPVGGWIYKNGEQPRFVESLIRFDLSTIPRGATIEIAILELYLFRAWGPEQTSIGVCAADRAWQEGTVTWRTKPQPAGDCVWRNVETRAGYYVWDLAALLQKVRRGELPDHGLILVGGRSSLREFRSREHAEHPPHLTVTYTLTSRDPGSTTGQPGWKRWVRLGRPRVAAGPPILGRHRDGRLDVFTSGGDRAIWHIGQQSPSADEWGGWTSLGRPRGSGLGTPAVGQNQDGRLELLAIGDDGALWHAWQQRPDEEAWSEWVSLGTPPMRAPRGLAGDFRPAVATNQDGRLEVFVVGNDRALWHVYQARPGRAPWSAWASLGGQVAFPLAARHLDGRLEVFVVWRDQALWHRWQRQANTDPWVEWISMDGRTARAPQAGLNRDGRLELFVIGTDGALWHIYQSTAGAGPWTTWETLGHEISGLAVTRAGNDRLVVLAAGRDGELWRISQQRPGSGWTEWVGPIGRCEAVAAGTKADGRVAAVCLHTGEGGLGELWYLSGAGS